MSNQDLQAETPIIGIGSRFAPELEMACPFDGAPTEQRLINYRITINKQTFVVPGVWASVCPECEESFFAGDVGDAIMDRIFLIQHPERVLWGKLMKGEIAPGDIRIRRLLAGGPYS